MPTRTKPDDDQDDDPWAKASTSYLLHRAQQLAADRFAVLLGESDLTLRQYSIMTAIAASPGASQSDLVRFTNTDRSTLADLLQRLERNGLIVRKESESDARAHAIELTANGRATLERTHKKAEAADSAILDALTAPKRRPFRNMLVKLAKRADALALKAEEEARRQAKKEAKLRAKERKKARLRAEREAASNDNPPQRPKPKPRRKGI